MKKNSFVEIQICITSSFLWDFMRPKIRTNKFQIKNQNQLYFFLHNLLRNTSNEKLIIFF